MDYKQKYLKYKTKYLDLKGGQHRFKVGDVVTVKDRNISSKIKEVFSNGMNYLIDYMGNGLGVPEDNLIGKCPFKVGHLVYVREPLRVIKMKNDELAGLMASELAEIQADRIRNPDSGELRIPSRSIVTVIEVLHKDSPTPLVPGSPQKVCYRLKVRYGSNPGININIYISSNSVINMVPSRDRNLFDMVPFEVDCENTWKFKTWQELVEICNRNPKYAEDIRNCQFDFYHQEPMTFAIFSRYFPCAIGLNLSDDRALVDADFREFTAGFTSPEFINGMRLPIVTRAKGIIRLNIGRCIQITDAAFVYLRGIHTLYMSHCSQVGITNAAFVNLRGIHTLYMNFCKQITDAAFDNLRGIHTLGMAMCNQITDAAFVNLRGIYRLDIMACYQITNIGFIHLKGIRDLDISTCWQVTDAEFVHLRGIHLLDMSSCVQEGITDKAFDHLEGIRELRMWGCRDHSIASARKRGFNVIIRMVVWERV